jgi:hypothetical protein
MPVSSPSYFPPNSSSDQVRGLNAGKLSTGSPLFLAGSEAGQNSTTNGLVIIGHLSGSGGIADVNLANTVIIGDLNAQALTTGDGTAAHPLTIVGSNNFSSVIKAGAMVAVGSNIFTAYTQPGSLQDVVCVGNNIFHQAGELGSNANLVVIGTDIGTASASVALGSSMIIATRMNTGSGTQVCNSCVIIGDNITAWTNLATSVLIGSNIVINTAQPGSSVLIGVGVNMTGNNGTDDRNVAIGEGSTVNGVQSVVLGQGAISPATAAQNAGNVVIGCRAGTTLSVNSQSQFVLEQAQASLGANPTTLMYGTFTNGNLVVGNSANGTNRDFGGAPGTNLLKLLNGNQPTGTAIQGGGVFTVQGGILSWIDQNGIQTQISNSTAGHLIDSANVALTNNAGAQIATITNGPLAGNPTKWVPINDDGTIRNIPVW